MPPALLPPGGIGTRKLPRQDSHGGAPATSYAAPEADDEDDTFAPVEELHEPVEARDDHHEPAEPEASEKEASPADELDALLASNLAYDELSAAASPEPEQQPEEAQPEETQPETAEAEHDPFADLDVFARRAAEHDAGTKEEPAWSVQPEQPEQAFDADDEDDTPVVDTLEMQERPAPVEDDLDIPELTFDDDVPANAVDDLEAEFADMFGDGGPETASADHSAREALPLDAPAKDDTVPDEDDLFLAQFMAPASDAVAAGARASSVAHSHSPYAS